MPIENKYCKGENEQFEKGAIGESKFRVSRREIDYTECSLNKLKQSLSKVDDAASLKEIKIDLSKIKNTMRFFIKNYY